MLAPSSDYGYAQSPPNAMNYQHQHMQSGARPKLFVHPHVVSDYNHMVHQGTPQHVMTSQHTMTPQHDMPPKYASESIILNAPPYYPPPQMLHVSSDYEYNNDRVVTPSSTRSSSKRSREDLNLKEKKRMFKLNDRINQLKEMLDEAGVQTKKNKQSILDNAAHYIEMLRSNLLIAKQKAERAEKQAEAYRSQAQTSSSGADKVVSGVFQKTTTPRVVVDVKMQTVTFNNAFVKHTGQLEHVLKKQVTLRSYLCSDHDKLHWIMEKVCETKQSISASVKAVAAGGKEVPVNLVAAVITDDTGKATNVEFSLIPLETSHLATVAKRPETSRPHEKVESSVKAVDSGDVKKENVPL
ncbi:hypothetical protein PsorP6_013357 [Peronosclerospora sorghi]|uniref:Uncharacterized protein n=1 Tax=Peronosclerospora sorghi TaxID=230839 RepID=A0ACC0WG52_9STRA|nr:hypothetical protein PsorP6_013357 [Peronosclerospora sorghi]